jgi:hypothetical protein
MNSAQFALFYYLHSSGFFKKGASAIAIWQAAHQSLSSPSPIISAPAQASQQQSSLFTPFFAGTISSTGITYPTSYALQGITGGNSSGDYIITGTKNLKGGGTPAAQGVVYQGPINSTNTSQGNGSGTWTIMNVPNGINTINNPTVNNYTNTSIYGVDNLGNGLVNLVGSVSPANVTYDSAGFPASTYGFYYEGPITATPNKNAFQVFQAKYPVSGRLADYIFTHSVDGGLAVGNYDAIDATVDAQPAGRAFIYNPTAKDSEKQIDIHLDGADDSLTKTAYGIWHNQGSSYTIAGGVGRQLDTTRKKIMGQSTEILGSAYLIDYDSITGLFSNYKKFVYQPNPNQSTPNIESHFEGIWSDGNGLYKLPATVSTLIGANVPASAATAIVYRNSTTGSFTEAKWELIPFNSLTGTTPLFTTNDSIFDKASVGAYVQSTSSAASDYAYLSNT